MTFVVYPAIDLREGRVVRLQYGDPARQTTFSDDPAAVARRWVDAGASWIHVVNLDGALDESGLANWRALPEVTAAGARVQFGGGMRTLKDIAQAFSRGVSRVVLGTAALEDPDLLAEAVERFGPEKVAVSIDARDGLVRTHGWQVSASVSAVDLGLQVGALGVRTVVFTDIARDGVLTGVNLDASRDLAQATGLNVIASGGVSSLEEVEQLREAASEGMSGVIIGRALYDGRIDLAEALALGAEID